MPTCSTCLMESANFEQANLTDANFNGATLIGANFTNAVIRGTNFQNTDLRQAQLKGVDLTGANFTNAIYDTNTIFDVGINPVNLGMKPLDDSQTSPMEPQSATPKTDEISEKAQVEQPKPKKTKEIWYRGTRTIMEIEESDQTPKPESTVKEIWYRGSRMTVAKKAKAPSKKEGMNYRGVVN